MAIKWKWIFRILAFLLAVPVIAVIIFVIMSMPTAPPSGPVANASATSAADIEHWLLAAMPCDDRETDLEIGPDRPQGSVPATPGCTSRVVTIRECVGGPGCGTNFIAESVDGTPFGVIYHRGVERVAEWYPLGRIPNETVPSNSFEVVGRDRPTTVLIDAHYQVHVNRTVHR